ncbi:MAG: ribosome hibernation-promoting factor, HPF/YfiA family, partial [Planctomycetota bacterium]
VNSVEIEVSVRHGQISDAARERIESKLEKLPRLYDRITAIELAIDLEHREAPEADLRLRAKQKHDLVATSKAEGMMAAVDEVIDKMEQQLRRHKDKVRDRHRPGLK